ncbi:MAG: hypothetical protein QW721_01965 [Desulfurococcaceae archaeon]
MVVTTLAVKSVSDIYIETPEGSMVPLHSIFGDKAVKFRNIKVRGWFELRGCSGGVDIVIFYKLAVAGVTIADWAPVRDVLFEDEIICNKQVKFNFKIPSDIFAGKLYDLNATNAPFQVWILIIEKGKNPRDFNTFAVKAGEFEVMNMAIYLDNVEKQTWEQLKSLRASGSKEAAAQISSQYFDNYAKLYAGGNATLLDAYYKAKRGEVSPICKKGKVSDPTAPGEEAEVIICPAEDYPYVIIKPNADPFELPIFTSWQHYTTADLPEELQPYVPSGATVTETRKSALYIVDEERVRRVAKEKGYTIVEKKRSGGRNCITIGKPIKMYTSGFIAEKCVKNPNDPICNSPGAYSWAYKDTKTVCDYYTTESGLSPSESEYYSGKKVYTRIEYSIGGERTYTTVTQVQLLHTIVYGIELPNTSSSMIVYTILLAIGSFIIVKALRR